MDCVGKIVAYDVVQLFCDFFLPFVDGQLIDGAFLILMETNGAPDYGYRVKNVVSNMTSALLSV